MSRVESSNIQVAVRIRPLIERELKQGDTSIIRAEDNLIIVFDPEDGDLEAQRKQMEVHHRSREQQYAFDKVFTNESIAFIYHNTAEVLIDPILKGYNGCVFAYGATGTGKTFTMLGTTHSPGLCNLTLKDIFAKINSPIYSDEKYEVRVSYVEIYNEAIRDLLVVKDTGFLDLRDDPVKGVTISGANEVTVNDTEEIIGLLHQGNRRRTTEATNANQTSSRSHAVFQVIVYSSPKTRSINYETKCGKLSLIDLAGSERGTVTENRGIRLREGAKINQSLLALANCINALGDKNKKGSFVPYRDSKLTRLLKDSLGGNCKTVMIVTVSPSSLQFEETVNTLKYANRAKNIKTKPIENKKLVELHIAEYKNIISDLRGEIDHLKNKLRIAKDQDFNSDLICICGSEKDEEQVKAIQEDLFENFQERIQLRRGLCELDAQNQLNVMEIKRGQKELMRLTLSTSGQLIEKKNNEKEHANLPPAAHKHMNQINTLQASLDFNQAKRDSMKQMLNNLAKEARKIMDEIPRRVKNKEKIKFLELVVKNHFLELENNEMQYNLKLQEKMSKILRNEIERMKGIMKRNDIIPTNEDEDEGDNIDEEPEEDSRPDYLNIQENPQNYDMRKKSSSKDKLGKKEDKRGKSPRLNTHELGKIRSEIAHAQEVINSVPSHIKEKAKKGENSLYEGIKGNGMAGNEGSRGQANKDSKNSHNVAKLQKNRSQSKKKLRK